MMKTVAMQALKTAAPPPDLTISEWADEYRRLSPEASAEAGRWSTSRAEYQRGMMDAVSDPRIEQVVLMTSAQIGKTEIINNICGYHVHQDAAPMLVVQPTLEMAKSWSQERFAPMIRDSDVLATIIGDPRSRDSGNTMLHKIFRGGHISIAGANSPSGLASRPIRVVLCDEVDRYPLSAGSEGDPVELAKKRSTTFWNRKIILVSTPTEKGASRIEKAFAESDQRYFYVPCQDCGEEQILKWENVQWQNGDANTAFYCCPHCGGVWDDAKRYNAVKKGKWIATEPTRNVAGFHLSALYSPWTSLSQGVQDFINAKGDPMRLKAWVNLYLGETWEEQGERIDEYDLYERREDWPDDLPEGAVVITAGVDVQDDRLAYEILATGSGHETWSIQYDEIYGDPSGAELWQRLDEVLSQTFIHPVRGEMIIRSTCIDSGGHYTQQVYNYARQRVGKRVFAIKGVGGEGKPIIGKPSKNNIGKINLFPVGTDTAKELIFARLKITEEGAGYCHFPFTHNEEYFRMLTSEKKVTKYYKGRPRREWVKIRQRNEALDCRVYAMAALEVMGINIEHLAKQGQNGVKSPQVVPKRRAYKPRPNNFVTGY